MCRPLPDARRPRCQRGREQPPGLDTVPTPDPARRVAHGPMSAPECSRVLVAICAQNARRLSRRNAPQIPCETRCTFQRVFNDHAHQKSAITTIRIELCSASSRLSLRSTLRAAALTRPPRSSKVASYVMADAARPDFCVDRMRRRSYRGDLVGAVAHPSAVLPDAERCSQRSQSNGASFFNNQ